MATRMTDTPARKPNAEEVRRFYEKRIVAEKKAAEVATLPMIQKRHLDAVDRWQRLLDVHLKAEAGGDGALEATMSMLGSG